MDSSITQPQEGAAEVGVADTGVGVRGSICPDFRNVICAIFKAVLLYGLEAWVMSPRIGSTLGSFRHRLDRILTGRKPQRRLYGRWVYPPLAEAMAEAGLQEVETYVSRRQNIVAQFVAARTIMKLFLVVERSSGSRVTKWWW